VRRKKYEEVTSLLGKGAPKYPSLLFPGWFLLELP